MAKYVKNPAGAVHSVADDFEAPEEWGTDWEVLDEGDAAKGAPSLFGAPDPAVAAAELHDRSDGPVQVADGAVAAEAEAAPEGGEHE